MKNKLCKKCNRVKPVSRFYKEKRRKSGYRFYCKECESNGTLTPNKKYSNYKGRAKFKKRAFSLTKEEFMSFWQKPCYYCGRKIETIGLDRIDSSEGYILSNVVACCFPCNEAKMRLSRESFIKIVKIIASRF